MKDQTTWKKSGGFDMNSWEQNLYEDICNAIKKEKYYEKIYWNAINYKKKNN